MALGTNYPLYLPLLGPDAHNELRKSVARRTLTFDPFCTLSRSLCWTASRSDFQDERGKSVFLRTRVKKNKEQSKTRGGWGREGERRQSGVLLLQCSSWGSQTDPMPAIKSAPPQKIQTTPKDVLCLLFFFPAFFYFCKNPSTPIDSPLFPHFASTAFGGRCRTVEKVTGPPNK